MRRKVNANVARQHLGDLLDSVYYQRDEVIIERLGRPMGVLIPMERYEALLRTRQAMFEGVDRLRAANAEVPAEEIESEVTKAVGEVRSQGKRRAAGE